MVIYSGRLLDRLRERDGRRLKKERRRHLSLIREKGRKHAAGLCKEPQHNSTVIKTMCAHARTPTHTSVQLIMMADVVDTTAASS